jgi:hypothetical protein
MFKSKTSYLVATIIMLGFAIYSMTYVITYWSSLMQNDRMLLFHRMILGALFTYKTIDYFIEWRNWGKPDTEAE